MNINRHIYLKYFIKTIFNKTHMSIFASIINHAPQSAA